MKICGKALEVSWYHRKNIEGPLRDFLKVNPWPHPCFGQTKGQNLRSLWPLGFLALGLALDVAFGLPLEHPLGDLQFSP